MIYKDILTESFNFKRTRSNYYTFTVPSTNKKMFVQFTKWLPNTYEVKFGVSNSNNAFVKANSKGNEIQILKTILDIMFDFVRTDNNILMLCAATMNDVVDKRNRIYVNGFNRLQKSYGGVVRSDQNIITWISPAGLKDPHIKLIAQ